MTEVAFHFNVPDKQAHACRLLRKAVGNGSRVLVTAEHGVLQQLDRLLWTFSQQDFISHAMAGDAARVVSASAVVLGETPENSPHHQVLLNLGSTSPAGFEAFERLIDIVSLDDTDRQLARVRWKYYSDRGYAITRHDIQTRGSN